MVRRSESSDAGSGKGVQRRLIHNDRGPGTTWRGAVEFLVNDELFYHAVGMTVPARPDSGIDTRQGPSGPKPKPDADDEELMDQDDEDMDQERQKSRVRRI